jgi:twitching motility protein PilT
VPSAAAENAVPQPAAAAASKAGCYRDKWSGMTGMFSGPAADNIRHSIARTLKAVISQRLVPKADGRGMVASVEIMIVSGAIKELIREGAGFSGIRQLIKDGRDSYGMQTFDDSLASLVTNEMVSRADALIYASSRQELELTLAGVGQ